MRALVLGGTGFIGRFVVAHLHHGGHEVAVFHRGTSPADFPPAVRRLLGDRDRLTGHATELRAVAPDVVIDMIPSSGCERPRPDPGLQGRGCPPPWVIREGGLLAGIKFLRP